MFNAYRSCCVTLDNVITGFVSDRIDTCPNIVTWDERHIFIGYFRSVVTNPLCHFTERYYRREGLRNVISYSRDVWNGSGDDKSSALRHLKYLFDYGRYWIMLRKDLKKLCEMLATLLSMNTFQHRRQRDGKSAPDSFSRLKLRQCDENFVNTLNFTFFSSTTFSQSVPTSNCLLRSQASIFQWSMFLQISNV